MIDLLNVQKKYPPDQVAVGNVTLRVNQGEFVFLAGASGAGKSTLLKLLFAAERASSGQVLVSGRNLSALDDQHIALMRREIGVVFQDYKLLERRSVLDNVAFTLEVLGVSPRERRKQALMLLTAFGLKDKADKMPLTLSGGEQQRVAIARALINRPKLLLADEPTGNLDNEMSKIVFKILLEANKLGMTVVVASHNLAMIEALNFRTIVLEKGRMIGDFKNASGIK